MKIGYPCINRSLKRRSRSTFRLKSYSAARLLETTARNLEGLRDILNYNRRQGLLFFRITSDLVPFASHPVCTVAWADVLAESFAEAGGIIRRQNMRICMHPDPFTLINSPRPEVWERSLAELRYHVGVLNALGLGTDAKIQLHVGGVYGDKRASLDRFVQRYHQIPGDIRDHLVIENDHRSYTVADCLRLHESTGVPVVLDTLHHMVLHEGEPLAEGLRRAASTWDRGRDGLPIVDFSQQLAGAPPGRHAEHIHPEGFRRFLKASRPVDCDVMLEIKDKEASALEAVSVATGDARLQVLPRDASV